MGYNMIYVKIPWATFAMDGKLSSDISLYEEIRGDSLVVSRGPLWNREMYIITSIKPRPDRDRPIKNNIIPCVSSAFATLPGILIHNHEQMCGPIVILKSNDPASAQGQDRQLKVGDKSFEFVGDDDGRRIGVKW